MQHYRCCSPVQSNTIQYESTCEARLVWAHTPRIESKVVTMKKQYNRWIVFPKQRAGRCVQLQCSHQCVWGDEPMLPLLRCSWHLMTHVVCKQCVLQGQAMLCKQWSIGWYALCMQAKAPRTSQAKLNILHWGLRRAGLLPICAKCCLVLQDGLEWQLAMLLLTEMLSMHLETNIVTSSSKMIVRGDRQYPSYLFVFFFWRLLWMEGLPKFKSPSGVKMLRSSELP